MNTVNVKSRAYKEDLYLSFVVIFQILASTLQLILPFLGFSEEKSSYIRIVITLITFIPAFIVLYKRGMGSTIASLFVYFFILVFNKFFFPYSEAFISSSQAYTVTPLLILTAVFITKIYRFDNFELMLLWLSRLSPIIAIVYVYLFVVNPPDGLSYNMSFGYSFLLPALYLFCQKSYIDKFLSVLLLVLILVEGSRTPVLLLLAFYFYCLLKNWRRLSIVKLFLFAIILYIIGLNLIRLVDIESYRTVAMILSGDVFSGGDSRDYIYNIIENRIHDNWLVGAGIGSDRYFLWGAYAHNIVLELSLHYGVIIMTLLGIAFLLYNLQIIKSKRFQNNNGGVTMYVIMLLYGFVPMLVSGSYLISYNFAILMGYLLRKQIKTRQTMVVNKTIDKENNSFV